MTPLHSALADLPQRRYMRWKTAITILTCSLVSMTIAVVVMGWQVSRLRRERHETAAPYVFAWPSTSPILPLIESRCHVYLASRASEVPSLDAVRRATVGDCKILETIHRMRKLDAQP